MREIKFRAWRSGDGGCMEFGHYVADHGNINWFDLSNSVGKDLILMQYTGLKDKNGKDIFEGDIVRKYGMYSTDDAAYGQYEPLYEVKFKVTGDVEFALYGDEFSPMALNSFDELEVAGNIYENKDLLAGEIE
jgi:uncharacterized phage protein (TIGR01671 family)